MIDVKCLCRTLKIERTNRKLNLTKRPTTLNVYSGGKRGLKGETATIQVGEVTTLPNGSIPTVTNTGDDHDAIFNFGIPQGNKGEGGDLNFDSGTGANRALVAFVGIAWADLNSITSVSYGGVAMTPMGATQNDEWGWSSVRGFYLVNPKTGANDFEVVTSDNSVANMTAVVLNGVDTSNPIGTVNSASGASATASVSLAQSASGNLLVAGVANGSDTGAITGSGGSTVQIMNDTAAYFFVATATKPTTGTGNLAIATSNPDDGWAIQGAEFRAVADTIKGVKVWNGTAWVMKPVKVWNGSSWVVKPLKRWDGSSWV